jgi:ABC-2 type transport system permease protein
MNLPVKIKQRSPFRNVVERELKRISKDPVYLFFTVIGPLLAFSILTLIFSANTPTELPVGVVDLDHSGLSRKISRLIDATPVAAVNRSYISLSEADKEMVKGRIDAVVCIPERTERNILRGNISKIAVYINNTYLIKGGVLSSGIQKVLGTVSAGIRLQSAQVKGNTGREAIAAVMPVQLRPVLLFNPYTSYSYYLTILIVPILLTVFVIFGSLYAIGTELQYGTGLEWLSVSNSDILSAIAGKLMIYSVFFCFLALVMDLVLFRMLELPLKGYFSLILAGEFLMIFAYQFMAIFIIALSGNLRLALSVASAYTMLAVTYAGLTFPLFGMPAIARVISRIFPFSYWLELFTGQALRGEPAAHALIQMMWLTGFILLGILLVPRLKYLLLSEKHWGRI